MTRSHETAAVTGCHHSQRLQPETAAEHPTLHRFNRRTAQNLSFRTLTRRLEFTSHELFLSFKKRIPLQDQRAQRSGPQCPCIITGAIKQSCTGSRYSRGKKKGNTINLKSLDEITAERRKTLMSRDEVRNVGNDPKFRVIRRKSWRVKTENRMKESAFLLQQQTSAGTQSAQPALRFVLIYSADLN